jgi:hypothetical protein
MRTTLNLDPKLLGTARRLAAARAVTLGDIISELANKGLAVERQSPCQYSLKSKLGFPVFKSPIGAPMIGLDDVRRDMA